MSLLELPKEKKDEYIKIKSIELTFKVDVSIIDGNKYNKLQYVYDDDNNKNYIYILNTTSIFENEKNKKIAEQIFEEVNRTIKKRNEKIAKLDY